MVARQRCDLGAGAHPPKTEDAIAKFALLKTNETFTVRRETGSNAPVAVWKGARDLAGRKLDASQLALADGLNQPLRIGGDGGPRSALSEFEPPRLIA